MTNTSIVGFRSVENRTHFLSGLYSDLLENGIRYFFPGATLERVSQGAEQMPGLLAAVPSGGQVEFEWMGSGYSLKSSSNKLSDATRIYKDLQEHPTDTVSKVQAQLAMAEMYENSDPQQAASLYKQIQQENPANLAGQMAAARLATVK